MYKALGLGHLGISLPLDEAMALAARHGFHYLSMSPDNIEAQGLDNVLRAMERYNILNSCIGVPRAYLEDGDTFWRGAEQASSWAKLARATGSSRAMTWMMPTHKLPFDEAFEDTARRLRVYAQAMWAEGVSLGIEFVGTTAARQGGGHVFIYDMPGTLRLLDAVGMGAGLCVDTHHCHTAGHDMDIVNTTTQRRVTLVHINDAMPGKAPNELPDGPRFLPGETGVIDAKRLLRNLKAMGYEGPVETEPFYAPFKEMQDADAKVRMVKEAMDRVWP